MAHPGGRPSKYDPAFIDAVEIYLDSLNDTELPQMAGFASFLGINIDTLNEWRKKYKEFSVALNEITTEQQKQLINDGIYGGKEVNATIVKLLLQNNHGMRERQDVTSDNKKLEVIPILGNTNLDVSTDDSSTENT